jgi:hypothetical protein
VYRLELRRRRHRLGTLSNSQGNLCVAVCEYLTFVCLSSFCLLCESLMCNCWNWNVIYMASIILCMCEEPEYHKYGRWGESWQTRCSMAGIGLVGRVQADTESLAGKGLARC